MRYPVEDLYSAAAAGGAVMTPDQIADAQRTAGELEAEVTLRSAKRMWMRFRPCSARRMGFGIIRRVADDYPEVGLSSSSVGR